MNSIRSDRNNEPTPEKYNSTVYFFVLIKLISSQINGDNNRSSNFSTTTPRPPPGPPVTPRTPRLSRQNGGLASLRLDTSADTESFNGMPFTPRGQSHKRSPTTPVDEGDDANGYMADYEKDARRVGSASKRLRGPDSEVFLLVILNSY